MGLHNGEQYRKTTFYVYSNTTNNNCSNVLIYIRGPYGTQGTATIPAFHNISSPSLLNCLHRQYKSMDKIAFKKEARKSFLKTIALDLSSLVNFEKKSVMSDIPVHVEMETDRAKISYIPLNSGIYEINLITEGERLLNCPFAVSVTENSSDTKESFDTTETILELPTFRRRKIVSKFIDCINEKILLKQDDSDSEIERHLDGKEDIVPSLSSHDGSPIADVQIEEESVEFYDTISDKILPSLSITDPLNECKPSDSKTDCYVNSSSPPDSLNDFDTSLKSPEPLKTLAVTSNCIIPKESLNIIKIDEAELETTVKETESEIESYSDGRIQKRPTSIVTPFLISVKTETNKDFKTNENSEENNEVNDEFEMEEKEDIDFNPRKLKVFKKNIKSSYVERLKAILVSKLTVSESTKTIKNLVDTSKKLKSLRDENNNSFESTNPRVTSPICPVHIVPEVEKASIIEISSIPVSEKRQLFTRQSCLSLSNSNNSSFSEKESGDVDKEFDEKYSLRLLSVIDTIRNSANSSLSRTISNSTPNISKSFNSAGSNSEESRSSFLETRNYWMSLSSTSINSTSSKATGKCFEDRPRPSRNDIKMSCERYRSAEDVSSNAKMNFSRRLAKSSSLSQKDFSAMEFVSLEERKMMLLQDQYEAEKMGTRFIKRKVFSARKSQYSASGVQRKLKDETKQCGLILSEYP